MRPIGTVLVALAIGAAAVAAPYPAFAESTPPAAQAQPILDELAAAADADARKNALERLLALDPPPVEELKLFLERERKSSDGQRRAVLDKIDAATPDRKGRFTTPKRRMTAEQKEKQNNLDWFAELAGLASRSPALGEVLTDVAAIRALSLGHDPAGAAVVFDFAFAQNGIIYRDECGRYLRKGSPYTLPALIRRSQLRGKALLDKRRYATYQLERLDRQNPNKALRDAASDDLKIEILKAFAESRYREAVFAVKPLLNAPNPEIREAARAAWMLYVESEPHPVPKRKLSLPGGKLSPERTPLWHNHRELQDVAVRRTLAELTGSEPAEEAGLKELSEKLFALYDDARKKELDGKLEAALTEAKTGDPKVATATFDAILVQNPNYERRAEMAPGYLALGEELTKRKEWKAAAAAFGKAHSVAPEGELAKTALGKHYYARGKEAEAEGGDASAEFARALEVDPDQENLEGAGSRGRKWMLYAGIGGGAGAIVLLILGLVMRRR